MQVELEGLQPALVKSKEDTIKMMDMIAKETQEVEQISEKVRSEEEVANIQAAESTALKNECEADLAEAIPAFEAALAALDTLRPADIAIVKTMKNPPAGVKLVMAAICIMKNVSPDKINDPSGSGKKVKYILFLFCIQNSDHIKERSTVVHI